MPRKNLIKRNSINKKCRLKKKMMKQEVPEDVVPTSPKVEKEKKKLKVVHDALLNVIDQSKLAPLIIKKEKYKVMTMVVPLLSQLVDIKSVVHHSVQSVNMEKLDGPWVTW